MREGKRDRTGETHGGRGDCGSLCRAARLCWANGGTAQVLRVLTPELCYSIALGTAQSPTALFPLPPLQLPVLSLLNCKTDQGDEMVQKICPTAQTWQGEWERRLEFLYEIFISLVAIPQRAVLNQKIGKYNTCGPTN